MTTQNNQTTVQINEHMVKFRKWKGKDKRKFLSSITKDAGDISLIRTLDVLVQTTLESHRNHVFSQDEYKYLLSRIRVQSLGNDMQVELHCDECLGSFNHEYKITDVMKPIHSTLELYDGDNYIKFGPIRNREQYLNQIEEDPTLDILFHIEEVNDNLDFSLEDLINFMDDLDLDEAENLVHYFEDNKFRIDDIQDIECPHCQVSTAYQFDELPGFFPEEWFEGAFTALLQEHHRDELLREIQKGEQAEGNEETES